MGSVAALCIFGCGDDDGGDGAGGSQAVKVGVGAECTTNEDCDDGQACLAFKGGYCGIAGCSANADCPDGSACVTHTDGSNYCFLECVDKADCNVHRPADSEANCVSSITFVEPESATKKACEPPSSDTTGGGGAGSSPQPNRGHSSSSSSTG